MFTALYSIRLLFVAILLTLWEAPLSSMLQHSICEGAYGWLQIVAFVG